jgi:hypothetical protein
VVAFQQDLIATTCGCSITSLRVRPVHRGRRRPRGAPSIRPSYGSSSTSCIMARRALMFWSRSAAS